MVSVFTLNQAGANCGPLKFLIQPAELEEVTLKVSQVSNANALSQVLEPPLGCPLEHVERPTKQFCRKLRLCICIGGCKQRSN